MGEKNKTIKVLTFSIINVVVLSFGHALGISALQLLSIGMFGAIAVFSPRKYYLPIMIFYLPWSSLLRTSPGMSSFHSIVSLLMLVLVTMEWLKKNPDLSGSYFPVAIVFVAYTLTVKLFNMLPLEPPYIFFMAMVFFIPIYLRVYGGELKFETMMLFLAIGNLSTCIAATIMIDNPNILPFMDINDEMAVGIRFSAFYSDPNYFSAQMLVAIAGLMIILTKTKKKKLVLPLIALIIALIYYALQSVSKAFILSATVILILWIFNLLIGKRSASFKIYLILSVGAAIVFAVNQEILIEQVEFYLLRFGRVSDVSSLTTGRVNLWDVYLDYLMINTEKLIFGIGLSEDQLISLLNTNNAHMTLIQMLYQIGVIGLMMIVFWWKSVYTSFMSKSKLIYSDWINMGILGIAIIMPWFGLDVLYFREFFYFPVILLTMRKYLVQNSYEKA
jgi:hypothetical protein